MNKHQRIVIVITILLVTLSGLFPPFQGEYRYKDIYRSKYMGYHSIFIPPSSRDVCEAITGDYEYDDYYLSMFNSHIILSRILVQNTTVISICGGLLLLFSGKSSGRKKLDN